MNKKGIIHIVEASVAILLIFSVLLIMNQRTADNAENDITHIISPFVEEFAKNNSFRRDILNNKVGIEDELSDYVSKKINRPDLGVEVKICNGESICPIDSFPETRDGNLYSKERIITTYAGREGNADFKKIKIFVWRK